MMQEKCLKELGARISGTNFEFHASGSYGAVFVDSASDRARKVFFRKSKIEDEATQKVFEDEVSAYNIAMKKSCVRSHVPKFYGKVNDSRVEDREGNSLSEIFNEEMSYEMDFIKGESVKLSRSKSRLEIEDKFHSVGIKYTADASIFEDHDPEIIIDFGTIDPEPPAFCDLPDKNGLWT